MIFKIAMTNKALHPFYIHKTNISYVLKNPGFSFTLRLRCQFPEANTFHQSLRNA